MRLFMLHTTDICKNATQFLLAHDSIYA